MGAKGARGGGENFWKIFKITPPPHIVNDRSLKRKNSERKAFAQKIQPFIALDSVSLIGSGDEERLQKIRPALRVFYRQMVF